MWLSSGVVFVDKAPRGPECADNCLWSALAVQLPLAITIRGMWEGPGNRITSLSSAAGWPGEEGSLFCSGSNKGLF